MDPREKFRHITLVGSEKLQGRTSGRNRESLIAFATQAATNYYAIPSEYLHVELENVVTLSATDTAYGSQNVRYIAGYEGDFTAEVIES